MSSQPFENGNDMSSIRAKEKDAIRRIQKTHRERRRPHTMRKVRDKKSNLWLRMHKRKKEQNMSSRAVYYVNKKSNSREAFQSGKVKVNNALLFHDIHQHKKSSHYLRAYRSSMPHPRGFRNLKETKDTNSVNSSRKTRPFTGISGAAKAISLFRHNHRNATNRNGDCDLCLSKKCSIARICADLCKTMRVDEDIGHRGVLDVIYRSLWVDWGAPSAATKSSNWNLCKHIMMKQVPNIVDNSRDRKIENAVKLFRSKVKVSRRKRRQLIRPESPIAGERLGEIERDVVGQSANVATNVDATSPQGGIGSAKANYPTSARQRFVRSYYRPWRWGHPVAGLSSVPVPPTDGGVDSGVVDKDILRVLKLRRYCQKEMENGRVSAPKHFDASAEFLKLHTFREHGKKIVQRKITKMLREREVLLHYCSSEAKLKKHAGKKLGVYQFAMRCWQQSFKGHVFRKWKDLVNIRKKATRALRFLDKQEERGWMIRKKRELFMHWRRSIHLSRSLDIKNRYVRAVKSHDTVESQIKSLETRAEKLRAEIRAFEDYEAQVTAKEGALSVILDGQYTLTATEASEVARSIAHVAAGAAEVASADAYCAFVQSHRVWSSLTVLHNGMRKFVESLVVKLRITKREDTGSDAFDSLIQNILKLVREFAPRLRHVFDHYARSDMERHGDAAHITSTEMTSLIHDSTLDDTAPGSLGISTAKSEENRSSAPSTTLSGIVQLCLQQALRDTRELSKRVLLPTFVLFLLRVAHVKYNSSPKSNMGICNAFRRVVLEDLLPYTKAFDSEMFQRAFFGSPSILHFVEKRKRVLDRVFAHYAGESRSKDATMTFGQFFRFVKDACRPFLATNSRLKNATNKIKRARSEIQNQKSIAIAAGKVGKSALPHEIVSGNLVQQMTLKALMRPGFCGVLFCDVQQTPIVLSVQENSVERSSSPLGEKKSTSSPSSTAHRMKRAVKKQIIENNRLSFVEFLESVGTIATLLHPNPYNILAKKVKQFFDHGLMKGCRMMDERVAPHYDLNDAFAMVKLEEVQHKLVLRLHDVFAVQSSIRDKKIAALGLLSHADFSGNGVRSMLMHDSTRGMVRARSVVGSKVDVRRGKHESLLL